ncbi:MAG: hypothetical protein OXE05_08560 [Chloroflexi bacterium]|nr:hypothetical protein [Chloroflexota bacterium]
MATLDYRPEEKVYAFETAEIQGTLRPGNEFPHHGLTHLVHKSTGIEFVHPLYAILNLYRFMHRDPSAATGMDSDLGNPRQGERHIEADESSVTLRWALQDPTHPEMAIRYEIAEPATIDMTVTVTPNAAANDFEALLACYFDPVHVPHVYLARDRFELEDEPGRFGDEPELASVVVNPIFRGGVLVYPRDEDAVGISVDGRWRDIARFSPVRRYKLPVCFQADREQQVAAVLMSRPEDCFAVSSGYDSPDARDRFHKHNPLYLSLFGGTLEPGVARTARARLVVTELDADLSQPLAHYTAFLAETDGA